MQLLLNCVLKHTIRINIDMPFEAVFGLVHFTLADIHCKAAEGKKSFLTALLICIFYCFTSFSPVFFPFATFTFHCVFPF